jgi:hypothetical protein
MATQEERLTSLEQFQQQTAKHIRSTDENFTILLGVIRDQGIDIKHIVERLDEMHAELNNHTVMLHQVLAKLDERK